MSERRADTIDIGRGIQYAKVASRLAVFHEHNEKCEVDTHYEWKDGWVIFSAKVITSKGAFTGHSLAKVEGKQKQFEKQETIAVGRALAFAGYLSSGDIACQEEMEDVRRQTHVTREELDALKVLWMNQFGDGLKGLSKPELAERFQVWVTSVVNPRGDRTVFNANEFSQWSTDELEACCEALESRAERNGPPASQENTRVSSPERPAEQKSLFSEFYDRIVQENDEWQIDALLMDAETSVSADEYKRLRTAVAERKDELKKLQQQVAPDEPTKDQGQMF